MRGLISCALVMSMMASAAIAQLRLPVVPLPALPLQPLPQTLNQVESQSQYRLTELRHLEIGRLIHANRQVVDTDSNGEPIVRSEVLGLSPTEAALKNARLFGFTVDREQAIDELSVRLVIFRAPQGMSTKNALRRLRETDPGGSYDYNHIYTSSGTLTEINSRSIDSTAPDVGHPELAVDRAGSSQTRLGLLDTGVDVTHPVFHSSMVHTWGCGDHVVPAAHGTAVASILVGDSDTFHGVKPGAELYAADVYCDRPTGGAVDALTAALGWMVHERVVVINISLVGPKNAMLERVIAGLIGNGYLIVAAVGNDGPAAPPLYPASYPHVVGVTAVDAHRRVLLEAARGPQVMFAAPGADLAAATSEHAYAAVRGTSFAAPIVAALLASVASYPSLANAMGAIDSLKKVAIDLGPAGPDLTYGFGLVGADYRIDPKPLIRQ